MLQLKEVNLFIYFFVEQGVGQGARELLPQNKVQNINKPQCYTVMNINKSNRIRVCKLVTIKQTENYQVKNKSK